MRLAPLLKPLKSWKVRRRQLSGGTAPLAGAGLILLTTLACAGTAPDTDTTTATAPASALDNAATTPETPTTKKEVVASLTAAVIVPRYEAAAGQMNRLSEAAQSLCDNPSDATLADARQAWRNARDGWSATAAMRFGPVMERKSLGLVDWPAAPPEEVAEALAQRDPISLYDVREFLPSDLRGLGVIEYLLFDDDRAILDAPVDAAGRRCAYLTALSQAAAAEVDAVRREWVSGSAGGTPYRAVFDGSAASSRHESAALADLVSSIVFLNRRLATMQLAPALGYDRASPDPAAIPGGPAHHAVADLNHQLLAIKALYAGGGPDGLGLRHLVSQLSPEVDQQTAAALEDALATVATLQPPLRETILTDSATARQAFDRITLLERLFTADIASLLNVTVGFSDQDGDS